MRKSILAVGVSASLTVTSVVVPSTASAIEPVGPAAEVISPVTTMDTVEAPAGVAVALGVLGLIGGGAYLAASQSLVSLPGSIAPLGGVAADVEAPVEAPVEEPVLGACDAAVFEQLVEGWPAPLGTTVTFCDGLFATAGANGTDWIMHFAFDGAQWSAITPDGVSQPSGYPCYNGYRISEIGGSEEFKQGMLICLPEETGTWPVVTV